MEQGSQTGDIKLEAGPASSMDFEQLWYVVREKAWLIALCGLLGIMGGLYYIYHTQITYASMASISVDANPAKAPGFNDVDEPQKDPLADDMVQTFLAGFRSRQFAQMVITKYQLLDRPGFVQRGPDGQMPKLEDAVGALMGMEKINNIPGMRLISVLVTHPDPTIARDLANILANEIVEVSGSNDRAIREEGIAKLHVEVDKASEDLKKVEDDRTKYAHDHNISLMEAHDTVGADLNSSNGELLAAKSALATLEADDAAAQEHKSDPVALLNIPSVANDPTVLQYEKAVDDLKQKVRIASLRWKDPYPKMIALHAQLADAQAGLNRAVLAVPDLLQSKRAAAGGRVAAFEGAVENGTKAVFAVEQDRPGFEEIEHKVAADQAIYEGLLDRLKKASVVSDTAGMRMKIFQAAEVPADPLQTRKSKTMGMSFAGGVIVGLVLAFGLHMMDSSVKTVDQAESVLGLQVLAAIPRQNPSKLRESSLALVKAPASPVAEAFRSLRTSVYLAGRTKGRKIVLFTSTLAGEGKTFCSANYATSLAQQGQSTLLIDADLRSPMVGTVMLQSKKLAGLGELLSGRANITNAIHESEIENLWIMPAGELLQNPAEVLASTNFGEILHQLGEKFERIVIDTAPVTAVSDTLLLLEHAQAICLVTHVCRTPRKWILRAQKLIASTGSRPIGVILNQMPMGMAGVYSYYPGKYGEPEVYGMANGSYGEPAPKPEPDLVGK